MYKILRISLIVLFFLSTLVLTFGVSTVNSPDEQANRIFAQQFVLTHKFSIDGASGINYNIIHPRSVIANYDRLVPVSFLGLPFMSGVLAMFFSPAVVVLVTPMLSVLAVLALREIVFSLTKNLRLSDLSAFFLLIHPAFWHYSARVMMHNAGFVSLLILAVYLVIVRPFKLLWINVFVSAILLGFALSFRLSEIVWVVPGVLILAFIYRNYITLKLALAFALPLFCITMIFGYLNGQTYGSPFVTGYTFETQEVDSSNNKVAVDLDFVDKLVNSIPFSNVLFPFGIHEKNILRAIYGHGIALYPWMSILTIIGLLILAKKKTWQLYRWFGILISLWLIVVYGSWLFHDNPDPSIFSVGNSYARYWLPIFVFAAPLCAVATEQIGNFASQKKWQTAIVGIIVVLCTLASATLVIFGSDGFINTRNSLEQSEQKRDTVISQTESNAIIITDTADKYLWPQRMVIVPLRNETTYKSIPSLLREAPLYYFGITLPQTDLDYLNSKKLFELGARIEVVITAKDETLYRIVEL